MPYQFSAPPGEKCGLELKLSEIRRGTACFNVKTSSSSILIVIPDREKQ
jgi:hypothetical protein